MAAEDHDDAWIRGQVEAMELKKAKEEIQLGKKQTQLISLRSEIEKLEGLQKTKYQQIVLHDLSKHLEHQESLDEKHFNENNTLDLYQQDELDIVFQDRFELESNKSTTPIEKEKIKKQQKELLIKESLLEKIHFQIRIQQKERHRMEQEELNNQLTELRRKHYNILNRPASLEFIQQSASSPRQQSASLAEQKYIKYKTKYLQLKRSNLK